MTDVKKILEDNGFDVEQQEDGQWLIAQYTPEGQDWGFYLEDLHDLPDYAENFDPEEEFEMWFEAKQNGVRGVPGIADLWKDQLWKQEILKKCASEVQ